MSPIKVGFSPLDVYMEFLSYPAGRSVSQGLMPPETGALSFLTVLGYSVFLLATSLPQYTFPLTLGL